MRIDYCPKCGKAGLRHFDDNGLDISGRDTQQRFEDYTSRSTVFSILYSDNNRWCPRCKDWVITAMLADLKRIASSMKQEG